MDPWGAGPWLQVAQSYDFTRSLQTLKRNSIMPPSTTASSRPSLRNQPRDLASTMEPASRSCCQPMVWARMVPARFPLGPMVKDVRNPGR